MANNTESTNILPQKLEVYIGGFSGPSFDIKLFKGKLLYSSHLYAEPESITPTPKAWEHYLTAMDKLDIWAWERKYDNLDVLDGTQWSVKINWGSKKVISAGSNCFPPDKTFEMSRQFKQFCSAVSDLLGGKDFR